jgi:hypothetical protein
MTSFPTESRRDWWPLFADSRPFVLRHLPVETTYTELKSRWRAGERDRELALHLLYLAWMHWADPPFVTGMNDDEDAIPLWFEIFEFLAQRRPRTPNLST